MPHANSTTSSPRWISPLESAMVLPCSEDNSWARLSNSLCTSPRNLNRKRAPLRVGRGPGRLRRLRVGDGLLHCRFVGEADLGLRLAGIGVEHVAVAAGRARDFLAADEMADFAHACLPRTPSWF